MKHFRHLATLVFLTATGAVSAESSSSPAPASMPATAEAVEEVTDRLGRETATLEERLQRISAERRKRRALVIARGRAYVRLSKAGLLPVGGGFEALVDHAARLEGLRRAMARDLERIDRLEAERQGVARQLQQIQEQKQLLDRERDAFARSHSAIRAAEERERAFRRAFSSSFEPEPHTAVYGSGPGPLAAKDIEAGFAALKGRLPFPLAGRAEIERISKGSSVGIRLVATVASSVRAVFPGRVAFAAAYPEYGQTVIVDHGAGYHTVSGGLGSIDVSVGDEVGAGDRLGTIGYSGGELALYFEVRKGGRAVDPSPWFGI